MYQVCSEATGQADPVCVVMAVDYGLHPEMHPVDMITLGDASGLTAMKNSDGTMVTLSWTAGTNANIHWVAGVRKNADGTYNTADVANTVWTKADMHSSHTVDVSGLTAGTYVFTVIAGQYNAATMAESLKLGFSPCGALVRTLEHGRERPGMACTLRDRLPKSVAALTERCELSRCAGVVGPFGFQCPARIVEYAVHRSLFARHPLEFDLGVAQVLAYVGQCVLGFSVLVLRLGNALHE